jgi:hypothetical protein
VASTEQAASAENLSATVKAVSIDFIPVHNTLIYMFFSCTKNIQLQADLYPILLILSHYLVTWSKNYWTNRKKGLVNLKSNFFGSETFRSWNKSNCTPEMNRFISRLIVEL